MKARVVTCICGCRMWVWIVEGRRSSRFFRTPGDAGDAARAFLFEHEQAAISAPGAGYVSNSKPWWAS